PNTEIAPADLAKMGARYYLRGEAKASVVEEKLPQFNNASIFTSTATITAELVDEAGVVRWAGTFNSAKDRNARFNNTGNSVLEATEKVLKYAAGELIKQVSDKVAEALKGR